MPATHVFDIQILPNTSHRLPQKLQGRSTGRCCHQSFGASESCLGQHALGSGGKVARLTASNKRTWGVGNQRATNLQPAPPAPPAPASALSCRNARGASIPIAWQKHPSGFGAGNSEVSATREQEAANSRSHLTRWQRAPPSDEAHDVLCGA